MDYKKKYKEALEKAKRLYGEGTITECLCHIFPELEESEGEKIRKVLIRYHKSTIDLEGIKGEDIIAWLEKQGSNNIKWNKNTKDNKPQVNHSVLMQTLYGIAEGEWKGEDWYQYRWSGIIKDNEVIAWIELSDIGKH